jgi:hypothetical protein
MKVPAMFSNKTNFLALLLVMTVLTGCATGRSDHRTPFAVDATDFPETRVTSVIEQDELLVRSAGKSGLFASKRSKGDAAPGEAAVAGLQDAVAAINVRSEMAQELEKNGRKGFPFPISDVESRAFALTEPAARLQSYDEGALLLVESEYYFTPDYMGLRVESKATLFAKGSALGSKAGKKGGDTPETVYANTIIVSWEVPQSAQDDPLSYWLVNDGAQAVDALRDALREAARLLVWDINDYNGKVKSKIKPEAFALADPKGSGMTSVKGTLILETVLRMIVRLPSGELLSLPNPEPQQAARRDPNS